MKKEIKEAVKKERKKEKHTWISLIANRRPGIKLLLLYEKRRHDVVLKSKPSQLPGVINLATLSSVRTR